MYHLFFLGPVILKKENLSFNIPRRQVRALFYRLAVSLEKLPRDTLCDMFWPDHEDATARRNLSHLLAHLHLALPDPELIQSSRDYLQLNRDCLWTDTERFLRLTRPSEEQSTLETLIQAVELYRGPLLAGFSLPGSPRFEEWLFLEGQNFEKNYLKTLDRLIEEWASRREYDKAIAYAQKYLAVNELAEEIHQKLMVFYAASGDRQSALRQFESCTRNLERELGIKPLIETRSIYQSILHGQLLPSQTLYHEQTWLTLPSQKIPLVGRREELSKINNVLENVRSGRGNILLISGEAGIGKTRIIQDFINALSQETLVASGTCQTQNKHLPYQPIVQALRSVLSPEISKMALPPVWTAELTRLLPELRSPLPELSTIFPAEPGEARLRLFEALVQVFLLLSKNHDPLVFLIDDLHNADSTTMDWLVYLSKRIMQSHLLFIGAYRCEETEAVIDLKHALSRVGVLTEIILKGLDHQATGEIINHFIGSEDKEGHFTERLQKSTMGNPFLMIETLRTLKETGKLERDISSINNLPLPESIRQAVEERLRRLKPLSRQILEAAAVFGECFSFDMIHLQSGRSEIETSNGLEESIKRQFISLDSDPCTYSFQHDLIRRAVEETLHPMRQQLLHRRAGWVLEQLDSGSVEALAYHFDMGGENDKAIEYHELAAKRAEALFAWEESERHQARLLVLLDRVDHNYSRIEYMTKRVEILIDRAHQNHLRGNLEKRDKDLALLTKLAEISKNPDLMIKISLQKTIFMNLDAQYEEAIAEAKQSLDFSNNSQDSAVQALLINQIGFGHYFLGEPRQALSVLEPALSKIADTEIETRRHLSHTLGYVYFHMGNYQRALDLQKQTYHCHQEVGDDNGLAWAGLDIGATYLKMGLLNEAKQNLTSSLELARKIGARSAEAYGLSWSGYWEICQGNYFDALQLFHQALSLELGLHSTHGRVAAEEGIGLAYYHLGDFHQAQHWLELASDHAHPIGHIRRYIIALTGLGMVKIQAWQLESSMIYLEKAIKAAKESECNEGLSRALAVLARAYRLCGDGETALEYAARAIQIAREVVLPACLMFGEFESGLAHLALGDPVTAAEHTRAAMELMASAGECWLGAEEIFRAQSLILKSLGNLSASDKYNQQAKDIIDAKAKHIPDPKLRQQYLEIHSFD